MNIALRIKNSLENLSKTEIKIANYILENTEIIKSMTSKELANNIGVGQSTIIKFVKKFGFSGYLDFKIQLTESVIKSKQNNKTLHDNISLDDPIYSVYSQLVEESTKSIQATFENINSLKLEKIIELINEADRIFLVGVGNSGIVAKDLQNKLFKIGKFSVYSEDSQVNLTGMLGIKPEDICIVFSHSGKTKEVIKTVECAKKKEAKIVAITSNPDSPIGQMASEILCTISDEGILRTSAMSSRIAQLSIVDILFLGLVQKNYDFAMQGIKSSRELVGWEK